MRDSAICAAAAPLPEPDSPWRKRTLSDFSASLLCKAPSLCRRDQGRAWRAEVPVGDVDDADLTLLEDTS